jgi:predicted RNA-binding Zn-ribbon protein involved in translation (DUF1610 family)
MSYKIVCLICGYAVTQNNRPKQFYCPNCRNIGEWRFKVIVDDEGDEDELGK